MKALRIGLKIVFANAVLLILPLTIVYAQEAGTGNATAQNLADASDKQLVEVLSSTRAEEAIETLRESINQYSTNRRIDEIERLIPSFLTAEGDNYVWEAKDSMLERARRYAKEGRHEDAELELRGLPHFLSGAAGNSVSEAGVILSERARRYAEEGRHEDMERLMRLLVPVLEDTSLDEMRRWRALDVMSIPARFETTADAAFDAVCRVLMDDPSARVRHRAAQILGQSRRPYDDTVFDIACRLLADDPSLEVRLTALNILKQSGRPAAIARLKKAALDQRNAVTIEHRDMSVSQAAIEALGKCGPDAAAVLLELRSNESLSREDQHVTINALARTGSADVALPEVLNIIETGNASEMCAAILGLGSGFNRYPPEAQSTIMDVFRAGLRHPNDSRRRATSTAMKYTGDFYLIPLIEPLLDDPLVRPRAESAIKGLQLQMTLYRQSQGIPDEERDMSIDDVIGLLGQEGYPWVLSAIRLRCSLADDVTRLEIYEKLATVAIQGDEIDDEHGRIARRSVVTILGQQREYRDEALAALNRILASANDLLTRDRCYKNISRLGGPEAIQILKRALLAGPPETRDPWSLEGETYMNLFMYLGGCGPDAAPVVFELGPKLKMEDDYRWWEALAATHNEELVMPFLLEKARTAVEWKRSRALHSLCTLAYKSSLETRGRIAEMLVQDADSEHHSVREVVAWGLGMVGNETNIELLERMAAEDPYSGVVAGRKGQERYERVVYPIREAAAKSIENIRTRLAKEQEAAAE